MQRLLFSHGFREWAESNGFPSPGGPMPEDGDRRRFARRLYAGRAQIGGSLVSAAFGSVSSAFRKFRGGQANGLPKPQHANRADGPGRRGFGRPATDQISNVRRSVFPAKVPYSRSSDHAQ